MLKTQNFERIYVCTYTHMLYFNDKNKTFFVTPATKLLRKLKENKNIYILMPTNQ